MSMTLSQIRYILALKKFGHFAKAAQECGVTQPTLSTQVQKLEQELGVQIFNRQASPVIPTPIGEKILAKAKNLWNESEEILQLIGDEKGLVQGEFKLGVIPTMIGSVIPLFIQEFSQLYPQVRLIVSELQTQQIVKQLASGDIDAGLLATPLDHDEIVENPLFSENFFLYSKEKLKDKIDFNQLPEMKMWLLEEGHCLRTQALKICQKMKNFEESSIYFNAGSLELMVSLVDNLGGATLIPELHTLNWSKERASRLHSFKSPAPARQVSLVTSKSFSKKSILEAIESTILLNIPESMGIEEESNIIKVY